jgi:hypothetical protein
MRRLNLLVLGCTSMFTALAFAQARDAGIKDRMIVQAQAGQTDGQGQTGQGRKGTGGVERVPDGKTGDPMATGKDKDQHSGGYNMPAHSTGKQDPSKDHSSSQARKGKIDDPRPAGR